MGHVVSVSSEMYFCTTCECPALAGDHRCPPDGTDTIVCPDCGPHTVEDWDTTAHFWTGLYRVLCTNCTDFDRCLTGEGKTKEAARVDFWENHPKELS